jgi:DNA-binding MarR family transcriptional regulator
VDRAESARRISKAVAELFFSAENQSKFIGTADELGLTPPMLKSMLELEPGEAVAMRHLADRWGCDASFVTVVVDGLEARGYVQREVAPHDRRIKTVELTPGGVDARQVALDAVYGPRAGFDALTRAEQDTLAKLLTKMAEAQAEFDDMLVDRPEVRETVRRGAGQRTREFRHGGGRGAGGGGWRQQLEAHREELRRLREELLRVRDEVRAQARWPDDAKVVKDELKVEAKAVKEDVKAELRNARKALRDEMVARRPAGGAGGGGGRSGGRGAGGGRR